MTYLKSKKGYYYRVARDGTKTRVSKADYLARAELRGAGKSREKSCNLYVVTDGKTVDNQQGLVYVLTNKPDNAIGGVVIGNEDTYESIKYDIDGYIAENYKAIHTKLCPSSTEEEVKDKLKALFPPEPVDTDTQYKPAVTMNYLASLVRRPKLPKRRYRSTQSLEATQLEETQPVSTQSPLPQTQPLSTQERSQKRQKRTRGNSKIKSSPVKS